MGINVEKAMTLFLEDLKKYDCTKKFAGGMVLHICPVGDSGYYIGTLTAYDESGLKSEKAVPFNKYIKIVNEIEDLIEPYQTQGFTGRLAGWNPAPVVRSFLYHKKVHRLFFLEERQVLPFLKNYTQPERKQDREVDVVVTFGH